MVVEVGSKFWARAVVPMVHHQLFDGAVYVVPVVDLYTTESAFYLIFIAEDTLEAGGDEFRWGEILMGLVVGVRAYTGGYHSKASG